MREYSLRYELLKREYDKVTSGRKCVASCQRIYDFTAKGDRQAGNIARGFLDRLVHRRGKNAVGRVRLERLDPDDEMPSYAVAIPSEVRLSICLKARRVS
ncbi:MAG: hypothetical protein PHW53_02240 [Patescibacteria group bacterium]|nr:hypothetical protein [Patescibacteria group bacterium]